MNCQDLTSMLEGQKENSRQELGEVSSLYWVPSTSYILQIYVTVSTGDGSVDVQSLLSNLPFYNLTIK